MEEHRRKYNVGEQNFEEYLDDSLEENELNGVKRRGDRESEDDFAVQDEEWWFDESGETGAPEDGEDWPDREEQQGHPNTGWDVWSEEPISGQKDERSNKRRRNYSDSGDGSQHKRSIVSRIIGWIIPAVLAVVFVYSGYQFLHQLWVYQQAKNEYASLNSYISIAEDIPESSEESAEEDVQEDAEIEYPKLEIDYDALKGINSQFVGVIYLPSLNLRYPVAQAEDNDKYLHTTFEGTYNSSGCIYLDCVASSDFSDSNTFIFGHNMKNSTMFGSLKKFLQDETLCDQDPYIYIYQEDQVLVYRIFAYYTIPVRDDVYDDFVGDDGYDAYVTDARSHSSYALPKEADEEIDWSARPNLLTLSTCYSTGHVYNFVVQGVLIGTAAQSAD